MSVYYETGIEEPEIMGSGSQRSCIVTTSNEEEAKAIFKIGGRNYLQKITTIPGKRVIEEWDAKSQKWVPQDIYQRYSPDSATVAVTLNKEELKALGVNLSQCNTSEIVEAIHRIIQHTKGETV